MNGKRLLAGAAEVDITPVMGTQIAGDIGRRRPAEILIDPIYAKALVLDDGQRGSSASSHSTWPSSPGNGATGSGTEPRSASDSIRTP